MKWALSQHVKFVAFFDQAVVSGGNFMTGILIARAFGAYEFGWFTLGWLVVEFISSLQFALILQPMLNIGPKEEKADNTRYYGAVAVQQLVVAGGLATLLWGAAIVADSLFPGQDLGHVAPAICAATIAYQAQNFFRRLLFCRERVFAALCNDVIRFAIQLAILLLLPLALPAPSAEAGIWIVAGACTISSVVGACSFGRFEWDGHTFRRVLGRHWTFSKWLLPSAVMYWLTTQIFVIMSGIVLGPAVTGSFKAAASVVGILNIMLQALDSFAPTQAARALHEGGPQELLRYMARISALTTMLMGVVIVLLSLEPEALLRFVYGAGFEGAAYLVRWMCVGAMLYCLVVLLSIWAAAQERTRDIFSAYAVASTFTIAAAYPLTRYLGLEGVLIGIVTAETMKLAVLMVPFIRFIKERQNGSRIADQSAD